MNPIRKVLREYLRLIGPTGFALYCHYADLAKERGNEFPIDGIVKDTGISKRSIIEYNKLLREYRLIRITYRMVDGRKRYVIRPQSRVPTGAKSAPNYNKSIERHELLNKHDKENPVLAYKESILQELFKHPRYDNKFYKGRFVKLSQKEYNNVERLMGDVPGKDVSRYVKWWVKAKSAIFAGFSFGALASPTAIEDWLVKVKRVNLTRKAERRANERKTEGRKPALILRYLRGIDRKSMTADDLEIVREAVRLGLARKAYGGFEIIKGG